MIGKNEGTGDMFHYFRMHELVPDDHILKLVDRHVDFSFVRDRVRHLYSDRGRPSVDPEVMVRMILVGYLFGITSERRLCEEVSMHVGYRWFCGLEMSDRVPHHSTFSKNRHGRFCGAGLWEDIFDHIVHQCIETGLVKGRHITADGTLVDANAALSSMEPIVVPMTSQEYLEKLREQNPKPPDDDPEFDGPGKFRNKGKKVSNKTHCSTTDPDATIARKGRFSSTKLRYQTGYIMDNASRVILDAGVSGQCGRRAEMDLMLEGLNRIKWRFQLIPQTAGADKGYFTGNFVQQLYELGITPHIPAWDTRSEHDRGIYTIEEFTFDASTGNYICPQGKTLKYYAAKRDQHIWRASTKDCGPCPAKQQCTHDRARSLSRHTAYEYIEALKQQMKTRGYKISQKKRKQIEELFGEAKELMGFRRMKFRGRSTVKEQTLLTAAAQNIKRLVKHLRKHAPRPAATAAKSPETRKNSFFKHLVVSLLDFFEYLSPCNEWTSLLQKTPLPESG